MANATSTTIGNQQLYNDYVLKGFVASVAPLRAFSTDVSPLPAQKGQAVNLVYVPSGSTATAWTEAAGYVNQAGTRQAVTVTLNQQYYTQASLTDIERANSSLMRIEDVATMNGRNLGLYVMQDIISAITASSFPNGYNVASSSLYKVSDLVAARKKASLLKWDMTAGGTKNVIVNPTVYGALLNDTALQYIYRGRADVTFTGQISDVYGWNNVYEANGFPSTMVSGSNTVVGIAANPTALFVAMRYLQPAAEANTVLAEAYPLTDPVSGVTLGYRKWFDANAGQVKCVYECVWGKSTGNTNAAINLTATVDA